jgi:hypothetical protein
MSSSDKTSRKLASKEAKKQKTPLCRALARCLYRPMVAVSRKCKVTVRSGIHPESLKSILRMQSQTSHAGYISRARISDGALLRNFVRPAFSRPFIISSIGAVSSHLLTMINTLFDEARRCGSKSTHGAMSLVVLPAIRPIAHSS